MQTHTQALPGTGLSFTMIKVTGGRFEMGGESWTDSSLPVHPVELSDYWIGKFPVTQEVWEAVMGKEKNKSFFKGKQRPVESVSWEEIDSAFLRKLNELTKSMRPTGFDYRLPTEAQWEYAARGASTDSATREFEFSGGNKLDEVGWYHENSHNETKPVGLKLPNELGLYDMSGNVWEWCRDWYSRELYKKDEKPGIVKDPIGPIRGSQRVLRGGSWSGPYRVSFPLFKTGFNPSKKYFYNYIGFRLAME